jgi:2-haloacid dehalogenase
MLDFARFQCLSFDCYGTLIDWESGMLPVIHRMLRAHDIETTDAQVLNEYAELEAEAEAGEYQPYRTILQKVMLGFARKHGFAATAAEQESLAASLPEWPPFPDTVAALQALKRRFKLAIISNTDDDLFAGTARHLGVPFDFVITAQQLKSYKPSTRNFEEALRRMGIAKDGWLHVAQSLFHDIAPARSLGISTVWVKRRQGVAGFGATRSATATPDLAVTDLKELVSLIEKPAP